MEREQKIDFYQLLEECNEKLQFSRFKEEVFFDVKDFIEKYESDKSEDRFVSYVFLYDKNHISYYPLFFIDRNEEKLFPIYNKLALQVLDKFSFEYDVSDNCFDVVSSLVSQVYKKNLYDKVSFVGHKEKFNDEVILLNGLYESIKQITDKSEVEQKYEGILKRVKTEEIESEINDNNKGFFAKEKRAIERSKKYKGVVVSVIEEEVKREFLEKICDDVINNDEKVLILSEESQKISEFLNKRGFNKAVFGIKQEKVIETEDLYTPAEERYLSFIKKRMESFEYPRFLNNQEFFNLNFNIDTSIQLDVSTYSNEKYYIDKAFLDLLSQSKYVKNSSIVSLPCYGLICAESKENYDSLIANTHAILICLEKIRELKSSPCFNLYKKSSDNLTQLKEFIDDITLICQYNDYDLSKFDYDIKQEEIDELTKLKNLNQAISSSTLMLKNLCRQTIKDEDLGILSQQYHSKNPLLRLRAKLAYYSILKRKNKEELSTLVKVVDANLKSRYELRESLPYYIEKYGEEIKTMNGLINLQQEADYIAQFKKKNLSLNDEFIKKCFSSYIFKDECYNVISKLNAYYDLLSVKISNFATFVSFSESQCVNTIFSKLVKYFIKMNGISYELFDEYGKLRRVYLSCSEPLKRTIKRYELKNYKMTTFDNDFKCYLIQAYYNKSLESFKNYQEVFKKYEIKYLDMMSEYQNKDKQLRELKIEDLLLKHDQDEDYKKIIKEGVDNQSERDYINNWKISSENKNIFVLDKESVETIPNDFFSLVVIINPSHLNDIELLNAIRSSKSVIVISLGEENDGRLLGYHSTILNKNSLYLSELNFDVFNKTTIDKLEENLKNNGLKLIRNSDAFPLIVENNKMNYALLPDVLVNSDYSLEEVEELRKYLLLNENLRLLVFDYFEYLIDNKQIFEVLK